MFREEGYAVDAASNGAEALDVARVRSPDLVVLDLTMPVMDGLTFLEHLRGDPAIATVPVVILTARRNVPVTGCAIVHKPFDIDPLLAVAARCLAEAAARAIEGR